MSLQRIILNTGTGTSDDFKSISNLAPGQLPALNNFIDYLGGIAGGNYKGLLSFQVGAVQATASITSTGAATAAETFTLCNQVFTARASGAVANEFNLSATVATQATNIAAAINASLSGKVSATASLGVVTITSVVPGLIGNGLQLSESLTNVTATAFSGGTDGTSYSLNFA